MKTVFAVFFVFIFQINFAQVKFDKTETVKFQKYLNAEYADPQRSPLEAGDLKNFSSLEYFPIDSKYFVNAKFVRASNEKVFEMPTSTTRKPKYVKYGTVYFKIDGKSFKLNVYQNIELMKQEAYKDYLFLPFSDLTSGNESYEGGRYIDLRIPKGDVLSIDFNQAYNPYCAYNHTYSCPLVPMENDLNIAIRAGVKKFHD